MMVRRSRNLMVLPADIPVAWRIAGGRRRYNAARRRARNERRAQITALVLASERPCVATFRQGWGKQLAASLGVHPSVISRDFAAIRETIVLPTPCCKPCARFAAEQRERRRLSSLSLRRSLGRILPPEAVERILRTAE